MYINQLNNYILPSLNGNIIDLPSLAMSNGGLIVLILISPSPSPDRIFLHLNVDA